MATFRTQNRTGFSIHRAPVRPTPAPAEEPQPNADESGELADKWWRESSFDLARGLDLREEDTIPGQLLDELFKSSRR